MLLPSRHLFVAALLAVAFPATAFAQQAEPEAPRVPSLRIGAGGALPTSDVVSAYNGLGPSLSAGLSVPLATRLDLTVSLSYNRFRDNENALIQLAKEIAPPGALENTEFDFRGGAFNFISGMVGLDWTFATSGVISFRLNGGAGVYNATLEQSLAQPRDPEDTLPDFRFDIASSAEGTSLAFQIGAGAHLAASPNVDVFVEPQYVYTFNDAQYLPVRVGVSYDGLFK